METLWSEEAGHRNLHNRIFIATISVHVNFMLRVLGSQLVLGADLLRNSRKLVSNYVYYPNVETISAEYDYLHFGRTIQPLPLIV